MLADDRSTAWEDAGNPPEFRRKVLDLVDAGRPIAEVAKALGSSAQSIYTFDLRRASITAAPTRTAALRAPPQGRVAPPALPDKVQPEHHQSGHHPDQHRAGGVDAGRPPHQQRDPDATQDAVDRAHHASRGEQHLHPRGANAGAGQGRRHLALLGAVDPSPGR
jgi:hypothetical protein